MIYLSKNATSPVILELTCISNLLAPRYLFEFRNDLSGNYSYFSAPDQSTFACRYNKFLITETGSTFVNLTNGIVNLTSGSYTYNVYESSAVTLNKDFTTGNVVSTGKAFVSGADFNINEIYR